MEKHEIDTEEILNFFINEVDNVFTINDPPGYDHRLIFHNCKGEYLEIFNRMIDIEERLEIGQIFSETYKIFDSSFYDQEKGYAYIKNISHSLDYGFLNSIVPLFININDKEYRSGIKFYFSKKDIIICPSSYPYCLKIYGFENYDDGNPPEYPLIRYYEK